MSDVDRCDAGQVGEVSPYIPAENGPSGLGGVGGDDQVVRAARIAGPAGMSQQAAVVRNGAGGAISAIGWLPRMTTTVSPLPARARGGGTK